MSGGFLLGGICPGVFVLEPKIIWGMGLSCMLDYLQMDYFSYMERPLISKNQVFLAVCKCSRLCANFRVGTFRSHIRLLAKSEFPARKLDEIRLNFISIFNRTVKTSK